jgi:DNA-binding NarL/FixJ family response regulator
VSDSARPRVFLVDDHELIRAGIKAEIADSVEIVGEADEVEAAIEMIIERVPDVVLLDVHMPDGGGQAVLRAVAEHNTTTRFLALSVSDAANDVISVIRAGARGYVTKNISGPDLIDAIYRISAGDVVFSPRLAGFVLDAFSTGTDDQPVVIADPDLDQLTARERQVLRLIARGYSYKDIAKELTISTKTVESHVSSVLRKLQLSSRYQLSHWASERNLN